MAMLQPAEASVVKGWRCLLESMTHLGLDAVQLLSLRLDQDRHVQEDLVELRQRLLELLDGLVPLPDLSQGVEDLMERPFRGCEAPSTNELRAEARR